MLKAVVAFREAIEGADYILYEQVQHEVRALHLASHGYECRAPRRERDTLIAYHNVNGWSSVAVGAETSPNVSEVGTGSGCLCRALSNQPA